MNFYKFHADPESLDHFYKIGTILGDIPIAMGFLEEVHGNIMNYSDYDSLEDCLNNLYDAKHILEGVYKVAPMKKVRVVISCIKEAIYYLKPYLKLRTIDRNSRFEVWQCVDTALNIVYEM